MKEKRIEEKLRDEVKKIGGRAIKFTSPYFTGMPDRMILMPGGRIYFVELKTTGRRTSPLQEARIEWLKGMGFDARVIDSQNGIDDLIKGVMRNEVRTS